MPIQTFTSLYRERDGGPVFCETNGGTLLVRLLSAEATRALRDKVDAQVSWTELFGGTAAFHLRLDGKDKPDWEYEGPEILDQDQDYDSDQQDGQAPPMPQKNAKPDQGDGGGGSDDDDQPVMWSEMTPYAEGVAKKFTATAESIVALDKKLVSVSAETSAHLTAHIERIVKLEKAAKVRNGKQGIFKIELKTPNKVEIKDGLFHHQFPLLLRYISLGMHCYIPGPPGTGKSHAAAQIAAMIGWQYAALSLGPTTPESRLMGGMDANGRFHEPALIAGIRYAMEHPELGFVFCLDEMDNGHPGILATLNSAMANGWLFAPNGDMLTLGANVTLIGAANTYGTGPTAEFAGRNKLDPATLDRFQFIPWDTDEAVETTLVRAHLAETENGEDVATEWLSVWRTCRRKVEENNLKIFVSMRGAINGAKLLAADIDVDTVLATTLLNKVPADQAKKINPL